MELETKIDFTDLKIQKNKNRKQFKKAIRDKDYNSIQECLTFVLKYDEMVETNKYEKYYNQLPKDTKEIIRLRENLHLIAQMDLAVYENFEKRISDGITKHINQYCARELVKIKKELSNANQQLIRRAPGRVKQANRVKQKV